MNNVPLGRKASIDTFSVSKDEKPSTNFKVSKKTSGTSDNKISDSSILASTSNVNTNKNSATSNTNNSTDNNKNNKSNIEGNNNSSRLASNLPTLSTSQHHGDNATPNINNQVPNPTPNPSIINTSMAGGMSSVSTPVPPVPSTSQTPTILNKNTITNINKSLKAKQKIVHSREPHPKNPTLISNIINTSPQSTAFPNIPSSGDGVRKDTDANTSGSNVLNLSGNKLPNVQSPGIVPDNTGEFPGISKNKLKSSGLAQNISDESTGVPNESNTESQSQPQLQLQPQPQPQPQRQLKTSSSTFMLNKNNSTANKSVLGNSTDTNESQQKQTKKKISKQNSTKTDFFAARLASAVDDIESSDSDETFVYENNDNEFDGNNNNNNNNIDTASINGSIVASVNANASNIAPSSVNGVRTPSIFENDQLQHHFEPPKQPFKAPPSNKAPSITNSINSSSNLDTILKRPAHFREPSAYSTLDSDARASLSHLGPDKFVTTSPSNDNTPDYHRITSVAHSINEGYNDDTFSYNEVEDDSIDEESTDDGEAGRVTTTNNNNNNGNTLVAPVGHVPVNSQQLQPQASNQRLQAPSVTPSLSTKNASKKNCKSSSTSSKLRSTTSKLFDKKGSQPRRYSTIPDDIDIEDIEDEWMYYDNTVRYPPNESTSLLSQNQRIPHYRSLNLNFPVVKRQNKRYLSTGQPLDNSDHSSNQEGNNNNNRSFPFPYQDQQHNFYYDYDEFDQESQRYSPNFDLPDLPLNRAASRNFGNANNTNNILHQNRFGNNHFILPRKSDHYSGRAGFWKSCIYTFLCISIVLTIGFVLGFVLATTKDLTNVGITSIENPIVSKDELVFNVVVEAFNPGWFSVDINEVELDLFARSGYLPDDGDNVRIENVPQKVETVKLGTVLNLESTMNFKGGFLSREPTVQKGEVKLLDPGKNITVDSLTITLSKQKLSDDNSKKWEIICANPFDLIITGVLKYDLPFARSTRSVVVRKTGYIDPTVFVIPEEGISE
ncbi:VAC7 Vacuolar segregation protein 7 [Candida maltosa Xu316]